jgi:hypothetical protein
MTHPYQEGHIPGRDTEDQLDSEMVRHSFSLEDKTYDLGRVDHKDIQVKV